MIQDPWSTLLQQFESMSFLEHKAAIARTSLETERRDRVVNTPASCSGSAGSNLRPCDWLCSLRFPSFFANAVIKP
jgi:hypothetical protein